MTQNRVCASSWSSDLKAGALVLFLLVVGTARLLAVSCPVVLAAPPSDADKAQLAGDYQRAADLYRSGLAAHPNDPLLTHGLVHALLRQQKVKEALSAAKAALDATPSSAVLLTLFGEVKFREGVPWRAGEAAGNSLALDPCNPRTHLLIARLAAISSGYATARSQLLIAHKLDASDPEIREEWLGTLPLKERIAELETYLGAPQGQDPDDLRHLHLYLEHLKKLLLEPHQTCQMVSQTTSTEVPFRPLMHDANNISAYGLDVMLNHHDTRLEIDTGAGGLVISRSAAQHAGLTAFSQSEIGGIGDQGHKSGYTAFADSIRIGSLEFHNCPVTVIDKKSIMDDADGLIGMDVLSQFLVTLDYPLRKLVLAPLPPRPGEVAATAPSLKTGNSGDSGDDDDSQADPKAETAKPDPQPRTHASHGPYDRYIAPEMKDYTPVYRVGHDLILPASLNDKSLKLFIMDTGAWATTISPEAAREVSKLHSDDAKVHGLSGEVDKVYVTDQITFKFAHIGQTERRVYSFDTSNVSKGVGLEISGFIGASTLRQLTIHIDYRDGLVKFDYDPNRGYRY